MDYKRLGKRIREERIKLNLTQAQLAEDIDISDTYMGAIERGERSLTLDTLVRLVNRLGVTVDYMLSDSVTDSDSNIIELFSHILKAAINSTTLNLLNYAENIPPVPLYQDSFSIDMINKSIYLSVTVAL